MRRGTGSGLFQAFSDCVWLLFLAELELCQIRTFKPRYIHCVFCVLLHPQSQGALSSCELLTFSKVLPFDTHTITRSGLQTGAVCEPDVFLLWFRSWGGFRRLFWVDYKPSADHAAISIVPSVLLSVHISELVMSSENRVCVLWSTLNYSPHFKKSYSNNSYFILYDDIIQGGVIRVQSFDDDKWPMKGGYWLGTWMNLHCNKDTSLSPCPLGELC